MRGLGAAIVLALGALPAAAAGQVRLGVRAGWAFPLGDAEAGVPLSDATSGQIPLQLEVSWVLGPRLALGAFGAYGIAFPGDGLRGACDAAGASCSAADVRAGLVATLSLAPGSAIEPWLGLSTGYEWLVQRAGTTTLAYHGWQWAAADVGAGWRAGPGARVGPVLSAGVGRFEAETLSSGGTSGGFGVVEPAVHGWITLSVRGAFDF
jgi:hypothetical protein